MQAVPEGTYQQGASQYVTRHELELFSRPIVEGLAGLNENVAALRKELASTRMDVGNVRLAQRPSTGAILGFLGSAVALGMAYFMVIDAREELARQEAERDMLEAQSRDTRDKVIRIEALTQTYMAWPPDAEK